MSAPEGHKGFKRLVSALGYSYFGLRACFVSEEAFRQEVFLALLLIPISFWIGETSAEKLLLCSSVLLVLIIELLNTAVERAIDRISFEKHELSKEAKDMGSAAVLLSLLLAGIVWGVICADKFL